MAKSHRPEPVTPKHSAALIVAAWPGVVLAELRKAGTTDDEILEVLSDPDQDDLDRVFEDQQRAFAGFVFLQPARIKAEMRRLIAMPWTAFGVVNSPDDLPTVH